MHFLRWFREPLVASLAEGWISARESRAQGLVKAYGTSESVDRLSALLDRSFDLKEDPMSQPQPLLEAQ
jgi:hypothetical protein